MAGYAPLWCRGCSGAFWPFVVTWELRYCCIGCAWAAEAAGSDQAAGYQRLARALVEAS